MLLAVDIGNTNTVVGVFDQFDLKGHFRVASAGNLTSDEAGMFLTGLLQRMDISSSVIDRVVIASVVPNLTPVYEMTSQKYFQSVPVIVSAHVNLPITVEISQPDEVGADRLANSAAAYAEHGGPLIVVDFGTATTFDVVNETGAYVGGVIIPGPETSMAELARKAARLFEVRIEPPDSVVGKSTAGALKSGLFHGLVGQVDHIIEKIIAETGFASPAIIATGGSVSGIDQHSRYIAGIDPVLTLKGLRLIADLN
jgi:type III pantothenate kinase